MVRLRRAWIALALAVATSAHAAAPAAAGEQYALLVAVRQYIKSELTPLKFTENDIAGLAATLKESGYTADNIVVMTQSAGAVDARYLPTVANIRQQLDLLLAEPGADDTVLVAFSGHGIQFKDDADVYFCPADARLKDRETLLSLGDVYQSLEACQAASRVLLVDACRNDPQSNINKAAGEIELEPVGKRAAPTAPPGGIAAFFSCSAGQRSFEAPDLERGVFFHFIIEGLKGEADLDKDREITLAELELFAGKQVQRYVRTELTEKQVPERRGESRGLVTLARLPERRPDSTLGIKLVLVPAGSFTMGSPETKEQLAKSFTLPPKWNFDSERPQHAVRITKPFYLGAHEVTRGQFARFVGAAGYRTDAEKDPMGGWGWDGKLLKRDPRFNWKSWSAPQTDEHPVVNVSWNDASAFCAWLSKLENRSYRLPTEAEWEYAARAGTKTRFFNGDDPERLVEIANVADAATKATLATQTIAIKANDGFNFTSPVGRFQANAFGLFDMSGNAWEWCSDTYGQNYYAKSPFDDPTGPATGSERVIRGGGWDLYPVFCRLATRDHYVPKTFSYTTGFRVACDR